MKTNNKNDWKRETKSGLLPEKGAGAHNCGFMSNASGSGEWGPGCTCQEFSCELTCVGCAPLTCALDAARHKKEAHIEMLRLMMPTTIAMRLQFGISSAEMK
jgi:hypothetical protein